MCGAAGAAADLSWVNINFGQTNKKHSEPVLKEKKLQTLVSDCDLPRELKFKVFIFIYKDPESIFLSAVDRNISSNFLSGGSCWEASNYNG